MPHRPPGTTALDLQHVGDLFDNYLHPIDTTAFGGESDLDANEVVIVLLERPGESTGAQLQ